MRLVVCTPCILCKQLQETPLHFAAKYGHKDIVSFLLKLAVDTKAVNKHGETASDVACKNSSDAQCKRRIQDLLSGTNSHMLMVHNLLARKSN